MRIRICDCPSEQSIAQCHEIYRSLSRGTEMSLGGELTLRNTEADRNQGEN